MAEIRAGPSWDAANANPQEGERIALDVARQNAGDDAAVEAHLFGLIAGGLCARAALGRAR